MRALFLFLLLANVAFFAWSRHFAPPQPPAAGGSGAGREVAPEKLKIVPRAAPAAAAPSAPAPAKPRAVSAAAGKCLEWGAFTLADYPRAQQALEPLGLGERLVPRRTEETAGWWVFIPPQSNRQGALRKAGELKALGVHDYFIVGEESGSRWALSLGVFRTEEAARGRLADLRAQGVRSAQIAPRQTVVPKVWLQVKGVDPALEVRLLEAAGQMEGSELRACPPG